MTKKSGRQKGAQRHAEGTQGRKTKARQREILESGPAGPGKDPSRDPSHSDPGEHRLFEDRQQHDEAEKNSEKTRLARDIDRHDHDREDFQVPGRPERHPRG